MTYSHVFLDFDETLFDHVAYASWADAWLAERFGHTPGFFKDRFWEFHDQLQDPLLRLYRHDDHTRATTGHGWDFISGELAKAYAEREEDFCYPDAHPLLEVLAQQPIDTRVLTFGDEGYQRYKLSTCKLLHRLAVPVHVVQEAKRLFLAREFGEVHGLMVDDKHPLELPPNWDEAWLEREAGLTTPQRVGAKVMRISGLGQIPELLAA